MMANKRVVVIGAGHGGSACVSALNENNGIEITVIERREASVHKFAGARALTQGKQFARRVTIPNNKLVKKEKGKVFYGSVSRVTDSSVVLEDGSEIGFDYLVCATGSLNAIGEPPAHLKAKPEMEDYYQEVSSAIALATKILVIGGGPVAIELVGEIRDKYPEVQISLVNNRETVLYNNPPFSKSFYDKINSQLKEKKITTYLNATVKVEFKNGKPFLEGSRTVVTSKGENIEVDLVLNAAGSRATTDIYPDEWKNENGRIKVNEYFQVQGKSNIFAIGDINDVKETKMGYFATVQGKHVAKSISKLVKNPNAELAKYKTHPPIIFVPIGKYSGAVSTPWISLGGWAASLIKGRWLFISDGWHTYNQSKELKNYL